MNLAWKRTPGLPAPGWEVLASNSYQVMLLILRHTEWGKCFPMSHFISAHESEESEALPDLGCAIMGRSLDFSVSSENWNKDATYLTYTSPHPCLLPTLRIKEQRGEIETEISDKAGFLFSLCKMRIIVIITTSESGRGSNEYVQCTEEHPAHSKCYMFAIIIISFLIYKRS